MNPIKLANHSIKIILISTTFLENFDNKNKKTNLFYTICIGLIIYITMLMFILYFSLSRHNYSTINNKNL